MASFARQNNSNKASVDCSTVYASGAFKNVYKGKYSEGKRAGEECVCKIFKSGSVYEASYFANELKVVASALEIVNSFNRAKIINKEIWLNEPTIWVFAADSSRPGENGLVEPMIANFEKFNSNSGWTPAIDSYWINAMQALSHYSYHSSNRRLLLCDLQGGIYNDGFVITDPVIMSSTNDYGPTDLGPDGISTFFSNHHCNQYCNSQWLVPNDKRRHVNVQKGTMMILPTRASRTPLTRNY